MVVDFAGMYPSIMMRYNICPSAFKQSLWNIPAELRGDFEEVIIPIERGLHELPGDYEVPEDFDYDTFGYTEAKTGATYNREYVLEVMTDNGYDVSLLESYVNMICDNMRKPHIHKGKEEQLIMYLNQKRPGIIPRILERLKKERADYKRAMKRATDAVTKEIFDQRQNAIKILMNSIYGIYGTQEGNFGFMEGSAATTFYGRTLIQTVNTFLVAKGCTIVYGDTDSSFFRIEGITDRNQIIARANELVDELNSVVLHDRTKAESYTQLELEKIMDVILIAKKKYIGQIWYPKAQTMLRGVAPVRGDTLPFIKVVYKELMRMVFDKTVTNEHIVSYYRGEMQKLLSGQVSRELLILSKKLNQTYNSASAPMNVYGRYLISQGEVAQPGTKLSFLIAKGTGSGGVGQRYRPVTTEEPIDYAYYHRLAKTPLEQLITAKGISLSESDA